MTHNDNKPYLNSDLHFLISCCKTDPSEDDIKYIHSYLSQITDHGSRSYDDIISLAYQHGIVPLVYKTLKELNSNGKLLITEHKILSTFKQQYLTISQRNMLMSAELIRIMKLLEDNGIEALVFKGPALSQIVYGDITLRQYVDLDVLVKKEDIYKIDTLLKVYGYQHVIKLTDYQEKLWLIHKHDLGLYHPKNGVHYEMHWSLLDEDYPIQMNQDNLWKNPQTVLINQYEIKTFPNAELLLYLCIHGSTHLWERIEWIKDIDLLIQTQTIDWEKIMTEAKSSNVETILYLGIYLAHNLFSTKLPSTVSKRIYHNHKLPILSEYIYRNWQENNVKGIGSILQRTLAMLRLFPDTKARLSYLYKIILKPTLNEYSVIDLPKGLYWFYYLVRPYLLIKKYVSKK